MAQGNKEHRMVFDIRGRRRYVVKVVYALLAVLMVASLFLVTGAVNLNSIFGTASSGESATQSLEKQAERIEAKLAKTPEDEDLLLNLTRTRISVANTLINSALASESQSEVEEGKQQLALASEDWSKYLKAAAEPSPGLANQVSPALFQLAQLSSSSAEALENVTAAAQAQKMVAEARPNLNSLSTLGFYQAYAQEFKPAAKAIEEATKLASTKFERESLENKYEEEEKRAKEFGQSVEAEKATAKNGESTSAGKEALENPLNQSSLGGG